MKNKAILKRSRTVIISIAISIISINFTLSQSTEDSLINQYSEKLIGTWLRQNEVIDGRGSLMDTTVISSDTLTFSAKNKYYFCQGANLERNWSGIIDSGIWKILRKHTLDDSFVNIVFFQEYSNLPLPLTNYSFQVEKLTETEFHFLHANRTFVYLKVE